MTSQAWNLGVPNLSFINAFTQGEFMSFGRKLLLFLTAVGVSLSAQAQLGSFLGGMLGGGAASAAGAASASASASGVVVSGPIERFNNEAALISNAVAYALLQITAALGTKQEAALIMKTADDLGKATDAKEVAAIQGTVIKDLSVRSQELLSAKDAKEKLQKLSPEIQKKVAQSILAVGISALKVPGLLDTGKQIVQGLVFNPMMITSLGSVKDGTILLLDALPKLGPIVSTGLSLMREIEVDPGNPSASAPMTVDTLVMIP